MIARHTLTYVGSRGFAAALNMAALAVFTRLAPTDVFGLYLLVLSWALVLYSATCQWPKFSFFALYAEDRAVLQVGTVVRLLGGMLLLAGLGAAGAAMAGLIAPRAAAAILVAVVGMTAFEGAAEIARTRLEVSAVALSIVLRSVLVLGLGSAALLGGGEAVALLVATALANMLAAIPSLVAIRALLRGPGDRAEARRLLVYGWPLVLSFAAAALAQTLDRLIIGASIGVGELGAYGAFADFLRQSFVVFGDSIALALVSIAKREAREGGLPAARPVLEDAARLLTVIAAFGAVFFLSFDDVLVGILLGPDYRETALRVAPLLVTASILQMLRAYYFGQVIYFTPTSHLDAVASVTLLVAIGALSAVLVPRYGVEGAALAMAVGQGLACLVFLFGSRGGSRMPVPVRDVGVIVAAAFLCGLILAGLDRLPLDPRAGLALKLACLAVVSVATGWAFNILGVADLTARRFKRAA
jgi:O-antigen/teichoic acid export membrane protein